MILIKITLKYKHKFKLLLLLSSLVMTMSCSGVREISFLNNLEKSNCYNQPDYVYNERSMPQKTALRHINPYLAQKLSFKSLHIANAFDILNLIDEYSTLKNKHLINPSIENKLDLIELNLKITQKINSASLEVSSVTSELDCEEERANQIANYLKGKADEREQKLIIGSIAVGAAGSITTEVLNSSASTGNLGSYVAIGTAITEAVFGVLMLTNNKKINYTHHRNTLGEIWRNATTSSTLPPSIWYYLTYKDTVNRKESLQEQLVKNWMIFGQLANKNIHQEETELHFGKGGKYSFEQLKNRADMYEQIEAYISLMKQDLKILSSEFENNLSI